MQSVAALDPSRHPSPRVRAALLLWAVIMMASPISEVGFRLIAGAVPTWLPWAQIAVLGGALLAGTYVAEVRALRDFCIVYGVLLAAVTALALVSRELVSEHGFISGMLRLQLMDLCVAALLLAVVWSLRRRRDRMFLQVGNLTAKFQTGWLRLAGLSPTWRFVAPLIGLGGGVCVLLYVRHAGQPVANPERILLLWAPVFAATNAFVEESISRNGLLSALEPHFGTRHAIAASALIFGIGHWNGLPYGVTGVVMTSALGYFTAKAMIETRGMFWSWFMHFIPDCVIFYYWGLGSLQRGDWGG